MFVSRLFRILNLNMTTRISNQFWTQLWHPTDHSGWSLYLDLPNTHTLQSICDIQFSSHCDTLTSFSINTKSIKQFTACSIFKLSCNIKRLINIILNVVHFYLLTALLMVYWWWMILPQQKHHSPTNMHTHLKYLEIWK